jgi:TolA-binding protein
MRPPHRRLVAGTVLALGALALPASASAHPGVLEVMAEVAPCTPSNTMDPSNCTDQRQYAVLNDGITQVWRESSPTATLGRGLVNYKKLPTAVRTNLGNDKTTWLIPAIITDLQIHATCRDGGVGTDAEKLEMPANVVSWQNDPFYDYIPFQKASANFGDNPASWIPVVKTLTGVDLDTVADPAAACASIGGTFTPADPLVTNATSASSATILAATTPLNNQITSLNDQVTGLNGQVAGLGGQVNTLTGQLAALQEQKNASDATAAALRAQVASLKTPLVVKLVSSSKTNGATVDVTGPPLSAVTVQLATTAAKAKSLGLPTNVLGTSTKTLDATGKLRVAVAFSKAAAKALKNNKGSLPLSVTALSAAKSNTVSKTVR